MDANEKLRRINNIKICQAITFQNININNYFESIKQIRLLELQKEIIKAIPKTNIN